MVYSKLCVPSFRVANGIIYVRFVSNVQKKFRAKVEIYIEIKKM